MRPKWWLNDGSWLEYPKKKVLHASIFQALRYFICDPSCAYSQKWFKGRTTRSGHSHTHIYTDLDGQNPWVSRFCFLKSTKTNKRRRWTWNQTTYLFNKSRWHCNGYRNKHHGCFGRSDLIENGATTIACQLWNAKDRGSMETNTHGNSFAEWDSWGTTMCIHMCLYIYVYNRKYDVDINDVSTRISRHQRNRVTKQQAFGNAVNLLVAWNQSCQAAWDIQASFSDKAAESS